PTLECVDSRAYRRLSRATPGVSRDYPRFSRANTGVSRDYPRFSRANTGVSRDYPASRPPEAKTYLLNARARIMRPRPPSSRTTPQPADATVYMIPPLAA